MVLLTLRFDKTSGFPRTHAGRACKYYTKDQYRIICQNVGHRDRCRCRLDFVVFREWKWLEASALRHVFSLQTVEMAGNKQTVRPNLCVIPSTLACAPLMGHNTHRLPNPNHEPSTEICLTPRLGHPTPSLEPKLHHCTIPGRLIPAMVPSGLLFVLVSMHALYAVVEPTAGPPSLSRASRDWTSLLEVVSAWWYS